MATHAWPIESIRSYFHAKDDRWNWRRIFAVAFIAAGTFAFLLLWAPTNASVVFVYSILLIACAGLQFLRATHLSSVKQRAWHISLSVFLFFVGSSLLFDSALTSLVFEALVLFALVGLGSARMYLALKEKQEKRYEQKADSLTERYHWLVTFFSALTILLLAIVIAMSWPASIVWALGLYIVVEMLLTGYLYLKHDSQQAEQSKN